MAQGVIKGISVLTTFNGWTFSTVSALVSEVVNMQTGSLMVIQGVPDLGFYNEAVTTRSVLTVFKYSAAYAWFSAWTTNHSSLGTINVNESSISTVHELAKDEFELRSVSYTYSVNAGAAANTNLKALIDADMPSGYEFVALSGFTSGNNACIFYTCRYYNNNYSLGIRNVGSSNVTNATAEVHYLCKST